RHVALEDLRPGCRRDALRPDHVLHRDRDPLPTFVVADVQVAVQLGVALVDRRAIGRVELCAADLLRLDETYRLLGGQSQGVDHQDPPGGTLKYAPSRSGAFASASSTERHSWGSSAAHTLTTSSGCDVRETSERSSSETLDTDERM